jgi:ABC-type polysaccharide/polyol phosphate export permease
MPMSDWSFAWYGAKDALLRQYQRTHLGPLWYILSQAVVLLGIALVFHSIFKQPFADFLPYISAGLLIWTMISTAITQAPTTFVAAGPVIQAFKISYGIFPVQTMLGQLLIFAHGLCVHAVIMIATGKSLVLLPVAVLAALLVAAIVYPAIACLGVLGARFRDLGPAIASAAYVLFLVSPILWERSSLDPSLSWIVTFNPITYMIEIVRRPLLGEWPALAALGICLALALVSACLGEWFFRKYSRPLPFWI